MVVEKVVPLKWNIVDLNIEDKNKWTPLHHAVRNNALDAIEFLLDNSVDDVRLNEQKEGAVHLGVIYNQLKGLDVCFDIEQMK